MRKNGGQEQGGSNGGGQKWSDSELYLEREMAGVAEWIGWGGWRVGVREELKVTAEFGLRWGIQWRSALAGKNKTLVFAMLGFRETAGNEVEMAGRQLNIKA